jgi:hypothetical protein
MAGYLPSRPKQAGHGQRHRQSDGRVDRGTDNRRLPWARRPELDLRPRVERSVLRTSAAFAPWDSAIIRGRPHHGKTADLLIGSIRRECLDHVIVFGTFAPRPEGLRFVLQPGSDPSLLDNDAPDFRQAQPVGNIVALPLLGGLRGMGGTARSQNLERNCTIATSGFEFSVSTGH